MSVAQKTICGCGLFAIFFLILFPPWQEAYKSINIPYRKDIGHAFIFKPPHPIDVREFNGTITPQSAFYVFMNTEQLLLECSGITIISLAMFFAFGSLRTAHGKGFVAGQRRFTPRIIAAALIFGFTAEVLMLFSLMRAFSLGPQGPPWAEWMFKWTQEPGRHFAAFLTGLLSPGFEAGVGYAWFFLFLIQGLIYGLVFYVLLATVWKK
jgi:hypothetical protein